LFDSNTDEKIELIQIECGGQFTVGLTKNGQIVSWGANGYGQLGQGDWEEKSVPTKVASALDWIVFIKISCGNTHAAALTDKGELYTWYVRS
jgi:alpha-tubulin suppressor-like RCC1 family protein